MKKTKSHKKNKQKSWDKRAEEQGTDIPVMSISTNWGKDRSLYYEGSGDSGTSSDEEHYINDGIEEERKHLSTIDEQSFRLFGNKKSLEKEANELQNFSKTLEDLEKDMIEQNLDELRKCVRSVVRDVTDAARSLQTYEFGNSKLGQARKQLLYSLMTNGCFYLHLVGSGLKETSHPALTQIRKINEILGMEGNDGEIHLEGYDDDEEEGEEPDKNAETENPEVVEKHIPDHLRQIEEGGYRPVTRNILKNQIIIPSKPGKTKAPRSKKRRQYSHAMDHYNKTHKKSQAPKDNIYKGEHAGIGLGNKSRRLHPAH